MQIANTSSFDGSIKMLSDMGLHDEKQRREDPHGRSLLPYKMSKVRLQLAYVSCFSQSRPVITTRLDHTGRHIRRLSVERVHITLVPLYILTS